MQRNEKIRKFFRDKGLYIGLGVCAIAVGISGWLFCREPAPETAQPLSPTDVRAAVRPEQEREPDVRQPLSVHEGEDGTVDQEDPEEENGALPEDPEQTDLPRMTLKAVSPLEGEHAVSYSMDKLSYNPTTRDWRTHAGVDILAPLGSDVAAAADGVVLAVYDDDLLGRTVTVRHAGGWVTHYSNLAEEAEVMAGDKVAAGQILGQVGSTALLEIGQPSHLHFAVFRNNVPRDPEEFLKNGD